MTNIIRKTSTLEEAKAKYKNGDITLKEFEKVVNDLIKEKRVNRW